MIANLKTYTFHQRGTSWPERVVECATLYRAEFGMVPTIAKVSTLCRDYPERVGVVKLEKGRGLFEFEMQLGVETQSAQQVGLLSALRDTTVQS